MAAAEPLQLRCDEPTKSGSDCIISPRAFLDCDGWTRMSMPAPGLGDLENEFSKVSM